MSSPQDFIAEDDIFIDAEGKVVAKKDARTKLASKGARVSPADVEKYGLRSPAAASNAQVDSSAVKEEGTAQSAGEKARARKGKE